MPLENPNVPTLAKGHRSFDFLGVRWRNENRDPETKVQQMERLVGLVELGLLYESLMQEMAPDDLVPPPVIREEVGDEFMLCVAMIPEPRLTWCDDEGDSTTLDEHTTVHLHHHEAGSLVVFWVPDLETKEDQ